MNAAVRTKKESAAGVENVEAPVKESLPSSVSLTELMTRVRAGDPLGLKDFRDIFSNGLRYILARRVEQVEVGDLVSGVEQEVTQRISEDSTLLSGALLKLVLEVARRRADAHIAERLRNSGTTVLRISSNGTHGEKQRASLVTDEDVSRAREALMRLSDRGREFLERFYLREQPAEEIRAEMKLTEQELQECKSVARLYFAVGPRTAALGGS